MTALTVLPIVLAIAACLTYVWCVGDAVLDDVAAILARRRADRRTERAVSERERARRALSSPRSLK